MISIYADGSSEGNVGPGGYGWLISRGEEILAWGYGGSPVTTNNLMEMEGALQGLLAAVELDLPGHGESLELVSDSQYTLRMASGECQAHVNLEAVERLQLAWSAFRPRTRWVPGHTGEPMNETCDVLAKQGKVENTSEEHLLAKALKKQKKGEARRARRGQD